VFVDCLADR